MDEDILELVSQYDKTFEADIYADDDGEEEERPKTADDGQGPGQVTDRFDLAGKCTAVIFFLFYAALIMYNLKHTGRCAFRALF